MIKVHLIVLILIGVLSSCVGTQKGNCSDVYSHAVPFVGNAWFDSNEMPPQRMDFDEAGALNWKEENKTLKIYFRTEKTGDIKLGLNAKVLVGRSKIQLRFKGEEKEIVVKDSSWHTVCLGMHTIEKPGYHVVELRGIKPAADSYGLYKELLLDGAACSDSLYFVKEDFYWGRRGPSVHLGYQVPEEAGDIEYFYNEITVPEGQDVLGSYFMANGFGEGYFGIQVNSPTERRILFSVWSPFHTDNPNDIPEEQRIKLLKKGDEVYTGKFGNEGSGGQSYLKYNWKAGITYGFLLKAHPSENNSTDYTAWFMDPELNEWQLIASFRRPQTSTYIKRPHSFLENFYTQMGNTSRMAYYTNQWVRNTEGKWYELTKAKFTADATARKHSRLDYAGGVHKGKFFMKNCGFFNERVAFDQYFERKEEGLQPEIDFSQTK
ncbi:DUF3472 domain-containing protein [Carboxylicivirga marina]|uniref:DUF3472 domain-containing protein n=1 Tax=Carboxylicivirga marina TaxID=2800988 RepID=A0ABS1HFC5_9BACT|nr:DUF3472 domain-containing protein [Carboxylicivirga marina]MBK3516180.1 DUF3472 domain-containing protein [Carboxylicivirga marina]